MTWPPDFLRFSISERRAREKPASQPICKRARAMLMRVAPLPGLFSPPVVMLPEAPRPKSKRAKRRRRGKATS